MYIPLQFFFCKHPGLALPLIALQYHEVKIHIKLRSTENMRSKSEDSQGNEPILKQIRLYGDYVYLDSLERKYMAQKPHQYLIEQLQCINIYSAKEKRHTLNFNHPIKELVWVFRKHNAEPMNFNITGGAVTVPYYNIDSSSDNDLSSVVDPTLSSAKQDWFSNLNILLNGMDRMSPRNAAYYRLIQPYQHHTRIPNKHIYSYSFALKPELHQPTGTCNFSRIDNAMLKLDPVKEVDDSDRIIIFAVNYNILRVMSGMGGLAYSN